VFKTHTTPPIVIEGVCFKPVYVYLFITVNSFKTLELSSHVNGYSAGCTLNTVNSGGCTLQTSVSRAAIHQSQKALPVNNGIFSIMTVTFA
jgi:hypothetical protein